MADAVFTQVTPHIHRLNQKFFGGRLPVAVWLVQGDDGWTVVDAGAPGFEEALIKQILATTGGKPPQRLIFTHGHIDHGAAAEKMYRLWGMPVAAGRYEIPFILGPDRYFKLPDGWLGHKLFQRSGPSLIGHNVQLPLDDGSIVDGMQAIHVPGHSPGMMALLHRADRALLAADCYMNINGKMSEPFKLFTHDLALNRQSMRKLAALDFDHLLPSHGDPIMNDGKAQLQAFVAKFDKPKRPLVAQAVAS